MSSKPPIASLGTLRALQSPLVIDVRDPAEVSGGKGGPPAHIKHSVRVPLNVNCIGQKERETTTEEFLGKLAAAGVELPEDRGDAIITHCGSGGRGGRAQKMLQSLGFTNVHNGGGPMHIAEAGVDAKKVPASHD